MSLEVRLLRTDDKSLYSHHFMVFLVDLGIYELYGPLILKEPYRATGYRR